MSTLNTAVNCLLAENEDFRFAAVCFQNSNKLYHYKCLVGLEAGDLVVVPTGADSKLQVVEVVAVLDFDDVEEADYQYRWVVDGVDTTTYDKCVAMEDGVMKRLRKEQRKHTRKSALMALFNDVSEDSVDDLKKLTRL